MAMEGSQTRANVSQMAAEQAECDQLRAEVQQLRQRLGQLSDQQRAIMELIGAPKPEKIIHEIRNIMNERNLLRTLTQDKLG